MVQNTLASTLKSFILIIIGNVEMSKDVMHKAINFVNVTDDSHSSEGGLYDARNYSTSLICKLYKRGVNIKEGVVTFEERFMAESDRDFLEMIVDSMQKGQHV